jgi:hypothetical protein
MVVMPQPFEVSPEDLVSHLDYFVDQVYSNLESSFLIMPRGRGFIAYARFQGAYEVLKRATNAFRSFTPESVWQALQEDSLVLVVVRAILGMTPGEWASLVPKETGVVVAQGVARSLDQRAREQSDFVARLTSPRSDTTILRLQTMVQVACTYIAQGAPPGAMDVLHRLDKVDTAYGLESVQRAADLHVPYAVLLYERYLGRPFASYRDAVSELVGEVMESEVEARLHAAHITNRKTKRAERVPGFDQAPDFIVPDELNPQVVIEAKITNDDGTARDKFTRIIHLVELSRERIAKGHPGFEVVACMMVEVLVSAGRTCVAS